MSKDFEGQFDDFARQHASTFIPYLDEPPGAEHSLAFHQCYRDYLSHFEGKISHFIEGANGREGKSDTVEDFYEQCRVVLDDMDAFHPKRFFIEALLATAEYPIFFTLMIGEARKIKAERDRK